MAEADNHNSTAVASTSTLILASASRFRRQMLENAGLAVTVEPSTVDEVASRAAMTAADHDIAPAEVARRLAIMKAEDVSRRHPAALVIGADQVLALGSEIFSKPADSTVARGHLRQLRNRTHALPTTVVLASAGTAIWTFQDAPCLTMRDFTDAFLDAYLTAAGASVTETVGGYMLEGLGAQLFDRIDGDYFTILGLPLLPLLAELRRLDCLRS